MMSRTKKIGLIFGAVVVVIIIIVVCATQLSTGSKAADSHPTSAGPWQQMRLSKNISPIRYNLSLDVFVDKGNYQGNVSIQITIVNSTTVIMLHKVNLNIIDTEIYNMQGKLVPIVNTFYYKQNEFWVIETAEPLSGKEDYVVKIQFNAMIATDLSGFYKGSYEDESNANVKLASTFFSPISARKAFPCFDEPSFKAIFQVTISCESKYKALSNMPEMGIPVVKDHRTTTYFQPSIKMSTYIICWVISDFKHISIKNIKNLTLKGWVPRNRDVHQLLYGLNATAVLLPRMEEYFDIPFPLTKLDVVAIPQFGPSAMENWGLITFRQAKFLQTDESTTEDEKTTVQIQAHELVHQWFGNLATMKFWNEAWLKEGFATFIAYIIIDKVDPSKEFMNDVLPTKMLAAMELDSFSTSHPISMDVATPDDIREVFDAITYYKGCCMVQMLYVYMGKETFRKGMQRYLKTYSYGNANQNDLWNELSLEAQGKDIKAVMDTWTLQLGYPVLTTKRINKTHMEIEQSRFSLDPAETVPPVSPFNYLWQIPIVTRQHNSNGKRKPKQQTFLLKEKKEIFPIGTDEILNPNHDLYYRVKYDNATFTSFTQALNKDHLILTLLDRTGLISDSFYLFKAEMKKLREVIELLHYIKNETEKVVWDVAITEMMKVSALLDTHPQMYEKWGVFVSSLVEEPVKRLGWRTQKTYKNSALQVVMLTFACQLNITTVVNEAKAKFREWMNGTLILDKNLYPVMRECAISNDHTQQNEYFEFTYREFIKIRDVALLNSMATTKDAKLIQRFLKDTMDQKIVKQNDSPYVIGNIAKGSKNGRELAWAFIKDRWDELAQRYGTNIFLLGRMLSAVLDEFSSKEALEDVERFFHGKTNLGSGQDAVTQSMFTIRSNVAYKNSITNADWFNSR